MTEQRPEASGWTRTHTVGAIAFTVMACLAMLKAVHLGGWFDWFGVLWMLLAAGLVVRDGRRRR